MPPKQYSLFDFFETPDEPLKKVVHTNEKVAELLVVNETPIDVEFAEEVAIIPPLPSSVKLTTRGRKKLTDSPVYETEINVPDDEQLFLKKYYSIGIVAEMFKVNISLIRFWEKEFDILKPKLNGKGDRHFRPEDVKNLQLIQHLLREKKYTIEGAKAFLKGNKKSEEVFVIIEELKKTKLFLTELKLSL